MGPSISRRGLLVGVGAAAGLAACAATPTQAEPPPSSDPKPAVADGIVALENRFDAFVGVWAADLDNGRQVANRADDPFAMCSTFKAYAAGRVLQKDQAGALHLTDAVTIEAGDLVENSPITETRVGQNMTIGELCEATLQRSDNTAGNWLLRIIGGPSAVTTFARTIGDDRTRLDRWETDVNSAVPGDPRDTSSPRALGAGYQRLLTGDVLDAPHRDQLERWMRGNQTSSLRAGLPEGWTSADKTGGGSYGSTNDVGVVYGPDGRRALLSIMTRSRTDDPDAHDLRSLVAEVTTLVLPYLSAG
ncbi:class A beta-lactamase [Mycobacterium sp. Root135]|uniref:class A beta-lactamase n=1 Tax=Mycobacterium sp. Root135 TaxID=1736457 RepID=UPI0006FC1966|nr:class A beta-lactamase [Mycobacterium sp. Root135]KQY09761.1 class A beta-lactamase [Mycobacterium sp. Root135]